ncbi:MAG TPA: hypothetical protein VNI01_07845 [Elusimicrobiota bacterium]|jgi:hypothetical protein|nr:hypothetical protein [Elusimicrobiota bacterium]
MTHAKTLKAAFAAAVLWLAAGLAPRQARAQLTDPEVHTSTGVRIRLIHRPEGLDPVSMTTCRSGTFTACSPGMRTLIDEYAAAHEGATTADLAAVMRGTRFTGTVWLFQQAENQLNVVHARRVGENTVYQFWPVAGTLDGVAGVVQSTRSVIGYSVGGQQEPVVVYSGTTEDGRRGMTTRVLLSSTTRVITDYYNDERVGEGPDRRVTTGFLRHPAAVASFRTTSGIGTALDGDNADLRSIRDAIAAWVSNTPLGNYQVKYERTGNNAFLITFERRAGEGAPWVERGSVTFNNREGTPTLDRESLELPRPERRE